MPSGYYNLNIAGDPAVPKETTTVLPCVLLSCDICGNTHLINLLQIGLGDLVAEER